MTAHTDLMQTSPATLTPVVARRSGPGDRRPAQGTRPHRQPVRPVLRRQGPGAVDPGLGPDAGGGARQGRRARRGGPERDGHDAQGLRRRGPGPQPQARLLLPAHGPGPADRPLPGGIRGGARPDRDHRPDPGAPQDPAAHRRHRARPALPGQPGLFPRPGAVHRGRGGEAARTRRVGHPGPGGAGRVRRRHGHGAAAAGSARRPRRPGAARP